MGEGMRGEGTGEETGEGMRGEETGEGVRGEETGEKAQGRRHRGEDRVEDTGVKTQG